MTSASAQRPTTAMTTAARSGRLSNFASMANGNEKSSQAIGPSFPSSSWQSGGIWGHGIGRRDAGATNSRGAMGVPARGGSQEQQLTRYTASEDVFPIQPSGSGALTATSEADPWGSRAGVWNRPEVQTRNASGSASPVKTRQDPSLRDMEATSSYYHPSTIGQQRPAMADRPKTGSGMDSTMGYLKFQADYVGEKENTGPYAPLRPENGTMMPPQYRVEKRATQDQVYGNIGVGGFGRDSGMPPPSISDKDGAVYREVYQQRPSLSNPSPSFIGQANKQVFQQNQNASMDDDTLHDRVAKSLVLADGSGVSNGMASLNPFSSSSAQSFQLNPASVPWESVQGSGASYTRDGFPDALTGPYAKRGSVADARNCPVTSYRQALPSPRSYPGPPQPGMETWSRSASRDPRMGPELDRRCPQFLAQQLNPYFAQAYYGSGYPQFPAHPYDPYMANYRQLIPIPSSYGPPIAPYLAGGSAGMPPLRPNKEQDPTRGVRSVLLEDFRSSSKSNKRFELKDIYNHIVEFSGDQHGSRFIQTKLETANSDEKDQVFREIEPNAIQLMKDVFGNYVIQKFFEHGNQVQKKVLAGVMRGKVVDLSVQMYACRVVQKALEHVLVEQQAELIKELEPEIYRVVKDQNGNHVVQKVIELVPRQHTGFIMDCFRGRVSELAAHTYGCRVVQRALEYGTEADKAAIMDDLHGCAQLLVVDQYGNYVIQHVIQNGKPEDKSKMIQLVIRQLVTLCKHKFASNVVEKCIEYGTADELRLITEGLTAKDDGGSLLQVLMKDQYGNYVIQKLLNKLEGGERDALVEEMKPQFTSLKKGSNNGKQIAAIDRLMFAAQSSASGTKTGTPASTAPASPALQVDLSSAAPTPNLTTESNSPTSSSPPSTGHSAVEETVDASRKLAAPALKTPPASLEVRVDESS